MSPEKSASGPLMPDFSLKRTIAHQPVVPRSRPPRKGEGMGRRVIALELSLGFHVAIVLLLLISPGLPARTQALEEPQDPIEVSLYEAPPLPEAAAVPPGPPAEPVPKPQPQAPELPQAPPQARQAAAPRPLPPRQAVLQEHPAPAPAPKAVAHPTAGDLERLLAQRPSGGTPRDEQRLAQLVNSARASRKTTPAQTPAGLPQGDPSTNASGLRGALASRAPLHRVSPDYPSRMQQLGEEGEVTLRLHVRPDGGVSRVDVVRSSGYSDFDRAAKAALRQWAFSPLSDATEQWGEITIFFRLN